ncbi:MAG: methyltransferase domain-containing protein [Planctomycetia bacterium]|nr:methyltransferase domain-containing protein [Planctomycetia bacterium]
MTMAFDKNRVRDNFSRAADTYDRWAEPQRRMAGRLLALLGDVEAVGSILEVGCGTGILTAALRRAFPKAEIRAIDFAPGMIERCRLLGLPGVALEVADGGEFAGPGRWDLIIANSCFQWFADFESAAKRFAGRLCRDGRFAFSVPVRGSLPELRRSYDIAAGKAMPELRAADEYRRALAAAGFDIRVWQRQKIVVEYGNAREALSALKGIGATGLADRPLAQRQLARLLEHYGREFGSADGRVPSTYHALYAVAKSGAANE